MSKSIRLLAALGLVAGLSACGQTMYKVVAPPEPISVEPTYTGKFK